MILIDRSGIREFQRCPRAYFWGRVYQSAPGATPGLERERLAVAPTIGTYVHQGIEGLVRGTALTPQQAALSAMGEFRHEAQVRGLEVEESAAGALDEGEALVGALILNWAKVRLDYWRSQFRFVSVEQELRTEIGNGVVLMSRIDAVVERMEDNRLFVINWKTAGECGPRWLSEIVTEPQHLLEPFAASQALGVDVSGVILEGIVKGRRSPKDKEGVSRTMSPLIYGYKKQGNPPLSETEYQVEYTSKKGFYRNPIWTDPDLGGSPVERLEKWGEWIGGEVREGQVVTPEPVRRDDIRAEGKLTQLCALAYSIEERKQRPEEDVDGKWPQCEQTCNNHYGHKCWAFPLCWEGAGSEPLASGFRARTANHPEGEE